MTDAAGLTGFRDPLWLWRSMQTTRTLAGELEDMFARALLPGGMHLSTGQEATAAGVVAGLAPHDWILPTYRNVGYVIGRGVPVQLVIRELLGAADGVSGGRFGAKHMGSPAHYLGPGNAIVGGGVATAVGLGLAEQRLGRDSVPTAIVGDGAMNQGVVFEALNLGAVNRVALLLVCENNGYGEMTPQAASTAGELCDRARSFGARAYRCDGNDALEVADVVTAARVAAVREERPVFIESVTYRTGGHMIGDPGGYRATEEVQRWAAKDPIARLEQYLVARGVVSTAEIGLERKAIQSDVRAARELALAPVSDPSPSPHAGGRA